MTSRVIVVFVVDVAQWRFPERGTIRYFGFASAVDKIGR